MNKKVAEITFPFVVSKGSVSVKIYRTPSHNCESFTLSYYQDGKRKRPTFPTFDQAKAEADLVVRKLASCNIDVLTLASADSAAYQRARHLLDPLGVSIEVAAAEYAHMKPLLKGIPLSTAVMYYIRKHDGHVEGMLVKDVVAELLAAKKADKCSARYLQCLKYNLGKFEKRFTGGIVGVTGGEIDSWLRSSGLSPRTRNNIRTSLHSLFAFAESKGYVPKDHDELNSVIRVKDCEGEIEVFTPAELTEILSCASDRMIPFLTLSAFAGIRHAEIQRLEWENVRFDEGTIEIGAKKAKTASRRLVPILPNLREWLMEHRPKSGLVVSHKNVAFELHVLAKRANQLRRTAWAEPNGVTAEELAANEAKAKEHAAKREKGKLQSQKGEVPPGAETAELEGWKPFAWKHNALRHSFISYRVAQVQDVTKVSLEAGNSPRMVFSNYRELVRPADAEKWFAVTPEAVEGVKSLRTATMQKAAEERPANVVDLPKDTAAA
jgi:integrase